MKKVWNSFLMAFSTYSVFFHSQKERNRENTAYLLMFVPLIGAIIGTFIQVWATGYPYLCDEMVLPAVVGAVIPSIISRGAHLDGFFRTVDALCSHKSRQKKLEILDDSHGGYFAIIVCVCYFMIAIGIWSEMPVDGLFVLSYGFVISRALYGLSILIFRHAKESKCTTYTTDGISKYVQAIGMVAYIGIASYFMITLDAGVALACLVGAAISFLCYIFVSYKEFGGVTEDCAGFFVQICEVMMPLAALIAYKHWW